MNNTISIFPAVDWNARRQLREEAHGLPAESEVLHRNHKGNKEPILIVFVMKDSLSYFVCLLFSHHEWTDAADRNAVGGQISGIIGFGNPIMENRSYTHFFIEQFHGEGMLEGSSGYCDVMRAGPLSFQRVIGVIKVFRMFESIFEPRVLFGFRYTGAIQAHEQRQIVRELEKGEMLLKEIFIQSGQSFPQFGLSSGFLFQEAKAVGI